MVDESLALLVEVAVGNIDIDRPGAVVVAAADVLQPRLASAEAGVESGSDAGLGL